MVIISKDLFIDVENVYSDGIAVGTIKKLKNGYKAQALNKGSQFLPDRDTAILWLVTIGQSTTEIIKQVETPNKKEIF